MTSLDYSNHELNIPEDLKLLLFSAALCGVVIVLLQKLILWPLARKLFPLKESKHVNLHKKGAAPNPIVGLRQRSVESKKPSAAATQSEIKALEGKHWKFVVSGTKFLAYVFFLVFGWWALQDQQHWFWDAESYYIPFNTVPPSLKALYFMETGYYLFTIVAMFFEPKMKDRAQMFVHHLFTITLLVTSYSWGTMRYGTAIMLLHDFSDPWMEAAKMFNYSGISVMSNLCFSVFAASFVYLRVYIFPRHIIRSTYLFARPNGYPFYGITFGSLVGLWCLHCFWSYLIYQVFHENVIKGNKKGDVREEDD